MANIQFRLNKGRAIKDESTPQVIYVRYKIGSKIDFNASLGFKVLKNDWDAEKQQVRNRSHITNRTQINSKIINILDHLSKFDHKNLEIGFTPSYEDVKKHYDSFYTISENKGKEKEKMTLFRFIDEFIETAKTKPNPTTKKLVSKNTLKDYTLTKNTLQNFNDEVYKIDFDSITLDWYDDFIEWCNSKGFKMNYTGKHIKTLKTFLNNALEERHTTNVEFKSRKFTVYREETDSIYLDQNELQRMWSLDLSETPRKEIARDLFLIGAFTGLRVSDYNNLDTTKIKNVNSVKMIIIKTQKTKTGVPVLFHPITEAIFQKYGNCPPPRIPDQHINNLIKEIAKQMGLNDKVELNYNRAGKDITVSKPKHELICTHTARRSFCTNAYLAGMDSLDIMSISGHNTEKNFKKYIKVTPEQVAIKMSQHPFFKDGSALKVV